MLLILIFWLITTFTFLSFGNILISIWNKILKKEDTFSFFDTFWIGLCAVGIFLMITSLVFPINIYINILLIGISILYWGGNYKKGIRFLNSIKEKYCNLSWPLKITLFAIAIIMIACNLKNLVTYDAGLYYIQTLMWNDQYSVVPGLGNLHSRFGFNSTFLLLSTLYYHPSYFPTLFPLNSLCTFLVFSWLIIRMFETRKIVFQVVLFLAIYIFFRAYFDMFSSLSTDILPNIIILYIFFSCILNPESIKSRGLVLFVLPMFCVTFKLSSAPICIISLIVTYMLIKGKDYKQLSLLAVISGLVIIPWCTRFVILTGYLIYPFPSIDLFNFDWKMPARLAELEKTIVYAWAKVPLVPIKESLETPIDKHWILMHLSWMRTSTKLSYALIILSPILVLIRYKRWKKDWIILLVWIISFSGVLLNFFTGPDPRFSQGFVIMAAICPFLLFLSKEVYSKIITPAWFIVLLMLFMLYTKLIKDFIVEEKSGYTPLYTFIYKPEPIIYGYENKDLFFYEYMIDGVIIYSTNSIGEDPEICYSHCNNRCYDKELPCTPYLNTNLELRGKSLQDGFRIKE